MITGNDGPMVEFGALPGRHERRAADRVNWASGFGTAIVTQSRIVQVIPGAKARVSRGGDNTVRGRARMGGGAR